MRPLQVLLIHDNSSFGVKVANYLTKNQSMVLKQCKNLSECLSYLHKDINIVIIDQGVLNNNENEILNLIFQNTEAEFWVLCTTHDAENIDLCLQLNIDDFVYNTKHFQLAIKHKIVKLVKKLNLQEEIEAYKLATIAKYKHHVVFLGVSKAMEAVEKQVLLAARGRGNVHIYGEYGTGKIEIAQAIHYNSSRNKKKFIVLNASSASKDEIEKELFGYEQGAFLAAVSRHAGKLEQAAGGTLYINGLYDLELKVQIKLYEALLGGYYYRVGGTRKIKLDVRIFTSTHTAINHKHTTNAMHEPLVKMLKTFEIGLPALRERLNDIFLLSQYFIGEILTKQGKNVKVVLSDEALSKLLSYSWPGNLRQLKTVIELALLLTNGKVIEAESIRFQGQETNMMDYTKIRDLQAYNFEIIKYHLLKNNYNVVETAKALNIGKSSIYRYIKSGVVSLDP